MNWEDLYYRAIKPEYTPSVDKIRMSKPLHGKVQDIILNDELLDPVKYKKKSKAGWDENF